LEQQNSYTEQLICSVRFKNYWPTYDRNWNYRNSIVAHACRRCLSRVSTLF